MSEKLDIDFQHDSSSFLQHVDLDFHIGHPQGAGVLFLQALQVELEPWSKSLQRGSSFGSIRKNISPSPTRRERGVTWHTSVRVFTVR